MGEQLQSDQKQKEKKKKRKEKEEKREGERGELIFQSWFEHLKQF